MKRKKKEERKPPKQSLLFFYNFRDPPVRGPGYSNPRTSRPASTSCVEQRKSIAHVHHQQESVFYCGIHNLNKIDLKESSHCKAPPPTKM